MKKVIEKSAIFLLPSLFWLVICALNIGAQSLANLIELVGVFVLSFIAMFIPNRILPVKYTLLILCAIALLLRLFTPLLPE